MAEVVSVSVPGELHKRWKASGKTDQSFYFISNRFRNRTRQY